MRVWTRRETAERLGVCQSLPNYWVKAWGPDSTHPFPQPVARVQMRTLKGFGQRQDAYLPAEVRAWFAFLPAAKRDRRSKSMKAAFARKAGVPIRFENRIAELEREVAGLRVMTRRASIAPLV